MIPLTALVVKSKKLYKIAVFINPDYIHSFWRKPKSKVTEIAVGGHDSIISVKETPFEILSYLRGQS